MCSDIQDFLSVCCSIIRFIYKASIDVNNRQLKSAIIEAATHLLFTANEGAVYDLMMNMYRKEHENIIASVERNIMTYSDVKLNTLMLELKAENLLKEENNTDEDGKILFSQIVTKLKLVHELKDPLLLLFELSRIHSELGN